MPANNVIPNMDLKNVRSKLIGNDENRAVSPVIGVILMVAITVILAAVIAAFVMDLGSSVESNVQAGVDVSSKTADPGSVTVTWISEGSAGSLEVKATDGSSNTVTKTISAVGDSKTIDESNTDFTFSDSTGDDNNVQLTVTAISEDGETSTVISNRDEVTL